MEKFTEWLTQAFGHANIFIFGKSGVGKSTLINTIFKGDLATTGQGKPVTKEIREYTKPGIPITVFDTPGLEIGNRANRTLGDIERFVKERCKKKNSDEHIHVAWICISEDVRRVEDAEIQLVNQISKHVPVIAVITKAKSDQNFSNDVRELLPQVRQVIRIVAQDIVMDDGHLVPMRGLEDLITVTIDCVPEGKKNAFAAANRISMKAKRDSSYAVVTLATTGAVAAGVFPIPIPDTVVITPTQIAMLAFISRIWLSNVNSVFITGTLSSVVSLTVAPLLGQNIATTALKLVPGINIAASLIKGGTSGVLTVFIGVAYIMTLEKLIQSNNGDDPPADQIIEEFKNQIDRLFKLANLITSISN